MTDADAKDFPPK